jgi:hypothetical protein
MNSGSIYLQDTYDSTAKLLQDAFPCFYFDITKGFNEKYESLIKISSEQLNGNPEIRTISNLLMDAQVPFQIIYKQDKNLNNIEIFHHSFGRIIYKDNIPDYSFVYDIHLVGHLLKSNSLLLSSGSFASTIGNIFERIISSRTMPEIVGICATTSQEYVPKILHGIAKIIDYVDAGINKDLIRKGMLKEPRFINALVNSDSNRANLSFAMKSLDCMVKSDVINILSNAAIADDSRYLPPLDKRNLIEGIYKYVEFDNVKLSMYKSLAKTFKHDCFIGPELDKYINNVNADILKDRAEKLILSESNNELTLTTVGM